MADGERVWFQNESEWPKSEEHVLHEFGRLKDPAGGRAGRLAA